jgi:hypothetical protein
MSPNIKNFHKQVLYPGKIMTVIIFCQRILLAVLPTNYELTKLGFAHRGQFGHKRIGAICYLVLTTYFSRECFSPRLAANMHAGDRLIMGHDPCSPLHDTMEVALATCQYSTDRRHKMYSIQLAYLFTYDCTLYIHCAYHVRAWRLVFFF